MSTFKTNLYVSTVKYIEDNIDLFSIPFKNYFNKLSYDKKLEFAKRIIKSQGDTIVNLSLSETPINIPKLGALTPNKNHKDIINKFKEKEYTELEKKEIVKDIVLKNKNDINKITYNKNKAVIKKGLKNIINKKSKK